MNNDSNNNVINGNTITPETNPVQQPVPPVQPAAPVTPVTPVAPAAPVDSVAQPQPAVQTQPVVQQTPVAPVAQPQPTAPMAPNAPVTPTTPVQPVTPVTPVVTVPPTPPVTPTTDNTSNPDNGKKTMDKKMIIYLCIILVLGAVFLYMLFGGKSKSSSPSTTPTATPEPTPQTGTLLEDVKIEGYECSNGKCNVMIGTSTYEFGANNKDLFIELGDYEDYVKVNIYYTDNGGKLTINDYKLFVKTSNEDISSVTNEEQLREKLGLFTLGTHTEILTLSQIGIQSFSTDGSVYDNYVFKDDKGNSYKMEYKKSDNNLKVEEGSKYKVTFETIKGTFNYEYSISNIEVAS